MNFYCKLCSFPYSAPLRIWVDIPSKSSGWICSRCAYSENTLKMIRLHANGRISAKILIIPGQNISFDLITDLHQLLVEIITNGSSLPHMIKMGIVSRRYPSSPTEIILAVV